MIKKMLIAVAMMAALIVPASAVTIQPSHTLECGSYTLYNYKGDSNTELEMMVVGPNKATFYLNTRYGSAKMVKPKVNGEYKRTTAWIIKYNDGEFHSAQGITKIVEEANDILETIDN